MDNYNHQKIESKWQKNWDKNKQYETKEDSKKKKFYCLDMFPYPSGVGLHVGHPEGYTASDIYSRYLRMAKNYNVLHPMGWDAFGLPAENFAIKTGKHPAELTEKNIKNFKRQIKSIGFSYDWSREINTTDPDYYKWTQWIFLKLFKRGLAYQSEAPINWCPSCKTGLANEEVVNGKCERCGTPTTQKNIRQWILKITKYADRLLEDLDGLDWPEPIKLMQRNWIGKSEGVEVDFELTPEFIRGVSSGTELTPEFIRGVSDGTAPEIRRPINWSAGEGDSASQVPPINWRVNIWEELYFVTFPTYNREPFFQKEAEAKKILKLFYEVISDKKYDVIDLLAMPEHIHFLVRKKAGDDLKKMVKNMKGVVSRKYEHNQQHLWAKGFEYEKIDNQKSLENFLNYLRNNPGEKGLKPDNRLLSNLNAWVRVFTTRPDTLFGATFMVLSPEHKLISKLKPQIKNWPEVEKYLNNAKKKSDLERTDLAKEKTGVELKGVKAINPVNNEEIPIWIADYVLASYGTGAIMAVPAHDQRDLEFAKKYKIEVKPILHGYFDVWDQKTQEVGLYQGSTRTRNKPNEKYINSKIEKEKLLLMLKEQAVEDLNGENAFAISREGWLFDSGEFSGWYSSIARERITKWLEKKNLGKKAVNYKLRDWIFSRQRYWGEPIPLVFCHTCKKQAENSNNQDTNSKVDQGELLNPGWVAIPENQLPLELPKVKKYQPTGTGESPLATIKSWVNTTCPKCGSPAKRETNTMPQWAGSCWYYLRYIDPKNNKEFASKEKLKHWLPVDLYIGGAEHAVLHLLYARFWHKVLYDEGLVSTKEPFKKLINQGMILGEDNQKMAKSRGNVINPDGVIKEHGADTLRLYEMFMGPLEAVKPWSIKGVVGVRRFLEKVWALQSKIQSPKDKHQKITNNQTSNPKLERLIHKTIKKVTNDIENFHFNTAISALMILTNEFTKQKQLSIINYQLSIILLSPFAPHITEELWEKLGHKESIFNESWPKFNPKLIEEDEIELVIQINGKVRDKIKVTAGIIQEQATEIAEKSQKVQKWIRDKEVRKVIFVKGKLLNIVI